MKHLQVYTSNRLEILVEKLVAVISSPLSSPIDQEIIVVQSKGMERWVSLNIAQRLGICANIRFPFPNAFVYEMIGKVIPDISAPSPYEPQIVIWKIMNLLPACIERPEFESIRNYLNQKSGRDIKTFQLAERIADTFDQYLLYRPEMILRWEHGEASHWQAVLWRELIQGHEKKHRAALGTAFFEMLQHRSDRIKGFPERVNVFGISALPRFHIQIFDAISRFTEVHLFLMNPCREYWGDILTGREIKKITGKASEQNLTPDELHLEKGNSLLASMGILGRDFFDLIEESEPEKLEDFAEPEPGSLLSRIQSDILNLYDRETSAQRESISKTDLSIQIHSCHSPMREIEVLQDQLLKMFEQIPVLLPKDILIMTPDIETYAPYIQAVFELPERDPRKISFTITDRSFRTESQVIETFLAILDLAGSRFSASQVLSILESPAVRNKFDLTDSDLDRIRNWVSDTRIRWGIDGESRREMGLPGFSENTWQAGLDRLMLGYAMPGYDEKMFAGILPYDHIEGTETEILGKFIEFVDQLFDHVQSLGQALPLSHWAATLLKILDTLFLADEDNEDEIHVIRRALNGFNDLQNRSAFNEKVAIQVIKCYLNHHLETEGFGYGFLTGGITFCAMLPMRSIPAKVICLIGMNDDAYPRQSRPMGFDLIARHPGPGDRSKRNDDRYLFLESVISARERLYISYIGQSIQDNSIIPPSVLVSELLDYIEQGFEIPGQTIRDQLITRHRLQPFSPQYFTNDTKLFSYANDNYLAAKCLHKPHKTDLPFISRGLATPDDEWKTISLADLCRFFTNPAKFLLNKRLGIFLEKGVAPIEGNESFDINGLERYVLEQDMVAKKLAGQDLNQIFALAKARGQLPHGTVGERIYEKLSDGVESFAEKIKPYLTGIMLTPLEVDLKISDFNLIGKVDSIYPNSMIQFRYAKIKAKDRLKLWIHHLVLNCASPAHYPKTSLLAALDPVWTAWEYSLVKNCKEILANLLQIFGEGLTKPLHFFPESSWDYVQQIIEKNKASEDARQHARNAWQGSDFGRGECEDLYYQRCFKNVDPIDSYFTDLSMTILGPIIDHQVTVAK